jgi:hypothetical protein
MPGRGGGGGGGFPMGGHLPGPGGGGGFPMGGHPMPHPGPHPGPHPHPAPHPHPHPRSYGRGGGWGWGWDWPWGYVWPGGASTAWTATVIYPAGVALYDAYGNVIGHIPYGSILHLSSEAPDGYYATGAGYVPAGPYYG